MAKVLDYEGLSHYTEKLLEYIKTQMTSESPFVVSDTAPKSTSVLWIDTKNGGIGKYYNSTSKSWETIKSVWG